MGNLLKHEEDTHFSFIIRSNELKSVSKQWVIYGTNEETRISHS